MNRREFLSWLGIGASAAAIAPTEIFTERAVAVVEYPRLYFTGLKPAQNAFSMMGQFIWRVTYIDMDGNSGFTPWYCNVHIGLVDLHGAAHGAQSEYIYAQFQNSAYSVANMMDGIMADGAKGLVQTGRYERVANPDFNPELPETSAYCDGEEWNPKMIQGDVPIMKRVKSFDITPYDDGVGDGWDIERLTTQAVAQLQNWIPR